MDLKNEIKQTVEANCKTIGDEKLVTAERAEGIAAMFALKAVHHAEERFSNSVRLSVATQLLAGLAAANHDVDYAPSVNKALSGATALIRAAQERGDANEATGAQD